MVMPKRCGTEDSQAEALIAQIRERAENLYRTRQLLCAESVVVTLNQALDGGLSEAQAVAVAAPFSAAMGDSGCICGALSGAVLACGLFLGDDQPHRNRKSMRRGARQLHDEFRAANGATCCRVLSGKGACDSQARFRRCGHFTANAAEMAARLVIEERPELIRSADHGFLRKMDSGVAVLVTRLLRSVGIKC